MEDIIQEAELSAGAVYTYFKSKDELILSAISTSLESMGGLLGPVMGNGEHLTPDELVHEALNIIAQFTKRKGLNFNTVILMCWNESQTNDSVKALIRSFHASYPKVLAGTVAAWQQKKILEPGGDPVEIAKAFVSFFYGFIVQAALLGEASPEILTRGLKGLLSSQVAKRSRAKKAENRRS